MNFLLITVLVVAYEISGSDTFACNKNVFEDNTDQIFFQLYKGPTVEDYVRIPYKDGLTVANYSFFNPNRTTVFHFHGFGETLNSSIPGPAQEITKAFVQFNETNFIAADYSQFLRYEKNPLLYIPAYFNNTFIAEAFAEYFKKYLNTIQPKKLVRFTAFSMGTQILHKVAERLRPLTLSRITALDPAGPIYDLPGVDHMSYKDADFVDVIHTDGGVIGDYRTLGHVDFFPNTGRRLQPSCNSESAPECSHWLSLKLYAESISRPTAFPAKFCYRNWLCDISLVFCFCKKNRIVNMGYHIDTTARGTYYLKTNDVQPFGLGKEGLVFR